MLNYLSSLEWNVYMVVIFAVYFSIYKTAKTKDMKFIAWAFLSFVPFFASIVSMLYIYEEGKLALNDYIEKPKIQSQ